MPQCTNAPMHQCTNAPMHLVAGGPGRPDGLPQGYYARPTIFADVPPHATILREEIFGPVLCLR